MCTFHTHAHIDILSAYMQAFNRLGKMTRRESDRKRERERSVFVNQPNVKSGGCIKFHSFSRRRHRHHNLSPRSMLAKCVARTMMALTAVYCAHAYYVRVKYY